MKNTTRYQTGRALRKIFEIKTILFVVFSVSFSLLVASVYIASNQPEVDSEARNGPIDAQLLTIAEKIEMPQELDLAASITYDDVNNRFFIATDEPHTLIPKHEARVFVLDSALSKVLYSTSVVSDSDLEGIAYMGDNRFAVCSEKGVLYFFETLDNNKIVERGRTLPFDPGIHKLASLSFDTDNRHLYSAEKEGDKILYQLDENGKLLNSFELDLPQGFAKSKGLILADEYTIAGMHYFDRHLYIFSEAYSTVFKFNIAKREIVDIYGIAGMAESAGITIRDGAFVFIGDFEDYLPPPSFTLANIP